MDGRRLRKWWLTGCLVAGALGCNRNAVNSPWDGGATPPGVATIGKKPFWGGSQQLPVDVTAESARKGPATPDTIATMADVQLTSAFDEKTVQASREALLDRARQGYQKALQMDPKNKAGMLGMARYYTRIGEREKAVEWYKKYLTEYPRDHQVAHEVALAHGQWKDWEGAVSWCDFALTIDPENLTFRKSKAFCLVRAGRWDEGFRMMCQVMPEAQARYNMARMLEHQNQPQASKQQLQLALKADPGHMDAQEFLMELEQGYHLGGQANPTGLQQTGYQQ